MTTTDPRFIDEVSGLLNDSAFEVFATIFNLELRPAGPAETFAGDEPQVAAMMGIVGDVSVMIYLHVRAPFARLLTRQFLRLGETATPDDTMINDVVGELANMILGSVKSRLSDQGQPCALTFPSVLRGNNLAALSAQPGEFVREINLACGTELIRLELLLKRPA